METFTRISLEPNLQIRTCVQIAVSILSIPEIQFLIESYFSLSRFSETMKVSNMIEKVAMEKIQSFVLPHTVQKMVRNCIMYMISQIIDCKNDYARILNESATLVTQSVECFINVDGTINQRNTAIALVENQNFNLKQRFELACKFCLEGHALYLWMEMASAGQSFTPLERVDKTELEYFIQVFENGYPTVQMAENLLESPALLENIHTLYHILKMVPYDMQHQILLTTALDYFVTPDVMRFCLSRLSTDDQQTVFENNPVNVLQSIVNWPNQFVFSSVANKLWKYLSCKDFCDIIHFILNKVAHQTCTDFSVMERLKEFWLESPVCFKEHIKQETVFEHLKTVLTCDMESFPWCKFRKAYFKYLDESFNS